MRIPGKIQTTSALVTTLTFLLLLVSSCAAPIDIPHQFPTPPPPPAPTPLEKLQLKPDIELEALIAKIAEEAKGKVGVAAVVLETGETAMLNADQRFPMQSVYKLPIAMAVVDQVRRGELDLDAVVGVTKDDFVRPGMRSPLRDKNPNGGEFTIRELIRLSLVESDGTASDVLMNIAGGAINIQAFLTQIGVRDMRVSNTEKEIGRDRETQFDNWATPAGAVELLRWLRANSNVRKVDGEAMSGADGAVAGDGMPLIVQFMTDSTPGANRLKGLLPKGTAVAHKTGTSGTQNGITAATNDIGTISLPNGDHLAIAVFVSDSPADQTTRESVIAKIAKAVWDKYSAIAK
ncbi:MAG: class A beta-lactamase [Pyrinomonadaceae bacterium]